MSAQKLLFIALLFVIMAAAWSSPSQSPNVNSSERRRLIKDFVAKVHELISILMKQLQQLAVTK
ncbi:uncharacterized protein [Drosophila suzukii]|uniref:Uncharacterized protein n=1 Tax=Drosophila suzukii TaxID=28584 RepID=A0AB39ZM70_DROSZ